MTDEDDDHAVDPPSSQEEPTAIKGAPAAAGEDPTKEQEDDEGTPRQMNRCSSLQQLQSTWQSGVCKDPRKNLHPQAEVRSREAQGLRKGKASSQKNRRTKGKSDAMVGRRDSLGTDYATADMPVEL